jgi:Tfp pilus assembly protein PilW
MLVAASIGTVVLIATFSMLDLSITQTGKVTDRSDATQRARLAMDRITRELRSQVCRAPGEGPILDGQPYEVTFYSFTGSGAFVPDKHTIAWDTNTNSLLDHVYKGSGTAPSTTYPASPTQTRTILTDVTPPPSNAPIFSYRSAEGAAPFTAPLAPADAADTTVIDIQFVTYPQGRRLKGPSTTLKTQVVSRVVDPNVVPDENGVECA